MVADVGKELSRLFVRSVSDFSSILEEMAFSKKSFDAIFSLTELRRRRESAVHLTTHYLSTLGQQTLHWLSTLSTGSHATTSPLLPAHKHYALQSIVISII